MGIGLRYLGCLLAVLLSGFARANGESSHGGAPVIYSAPTKALSEGLKKRKCTTRESDVYFYSDNTYYVEDSQFFEEHSQEIDWYHCYRRALQRAQGLKATRKRLSGEPVNFAMRTAPFVGGLEIDLVVVPSISWQFNDGWLRDTSGTVVLNTLSCDKTARKDFHVFIKDGGECVDLSAILKRRP